MLLATSAHALSVMIEEIIPALAVAGLEKSHGKARHVSLNRVSSIMVAGHFLEAQDDLGPLGPNTTLARRLACLALE